MSFITTSDHCLPPYITIDLKNAQLLSDASTNIIKTVSKYKIETFTVPPFVGNTPLEKIIDNNDFTIIWYGSFYIIINCKLFRNHNLTVDNLIDLKTIDSYARSSLD